jgi:hypothetical protein
MVGASLPECANPSPPSSSWIFLSGTVARRMGTVAPWGFPPAGAGQRTTQKSTRRGGVEALRGKVSAVDSIAGR